MKRWQILKKLTAKSSQLKAEDIIKILLQNRLLKTKKQVQEFLTPPNPYQLKAKSFGIKTSELNKVIKRIKKAIASQESIIVYSDFDADGICGAAILWETLNFLDAKAMPYIPDRIREGYGLSKKGIDQVLKEYDASLIITVDHGVTAGKKIEYAKSLGIETIVTDHHLLPKKPPKPLAIIHTTSLAGAGVAWVLAEHLQESLKRSPSLRREFPLRLKHLGGGRVERSGTSDSPEVEKTQAPRTVVSVNNPSLSDHLALAAIGTIADLIPLIGPSRSIVKYGLEELNQTKRIGLQALFKEAGLEKGKIGTYEVGFIIAPRLNSMGRLVHAIDSLRLLCTKDPSRAVHLAKNLGQTNRERQKLMEETAQHAKNQITRKPDYQKTRRLIFLSHASYHEGVIGLVAGKLVEQFYRPSIVVSQGKEYSKASARSINGFNIVEAIRTCSDLLVDCGGHPMAAGFTVETKHLEKVKSKLERLADREISQELLTKQLKIDCEIELSDVTFSLYEEIAKFAPFGIANPEPVFATRKVVVQNARAVGKEGKHLKLSVNSNSLSSEVARSAKREGTPRMVGRHDSSDSGMNIDAIAFGMGHLYPKLLPDKLIDIAYTILLDEWNSQKRLQLKIKDIKFH